MNTKRRAFIGVAALAGCCGLVRPVWSDTFEFVNGCGTGLWGTTCSLGGGVWQSNWGRTGANPGALLPGAADTCVLNGVVTLDVGALVAGVSVPSGATLSWPGSTLTIGGGGAMNSAGTVSLTTGNNKFLAGPAISSGVWSMSAGALYLNPGGTLTSTGFLSLSDGASVRRNGGPLATTVVTNTGEVRVMSGGGALSDLTLVSSPSAVWRSDAASPLSLEGVALSGVFAGDFTTAPSLSGYNVLSADVTLTTTPASAPWGWAAASINTGAFTVTNAGRMETTSPSNKFLTGRLLNASTGQFHHGQGALYFNPATPATTLINDGLLTLGFNTAIVRNGGIPGQTLFANNGTVRATGSQGSIGNLTVISDGQWLVDAGATLDLGANEVSGVFTGNLTGHGYISSTTLVGDTVLTTAPASVNPWEWFNGTLATGAFTLTNSGRLRSTFANNKFIAGRVVNASGGTWDHDQGAIYLSPSGSEASLTNNGLMTVGLASILRNGGAIGSAVFTNAGTFRALLAGGWVSGLTVVGAGGVWQTDVGATLDLQSVSMSGSMVGNHAGEAYLAEVQLAGNTTLSVTPGSVQPWRFKGATLSTGAYTLTNAGWFAASTTSNKLFTGTAVNQAGAVWSMQEGNFFLSPSGGVTTLTNHGTLEFTGGAVHRNGGAIGEALVFNDGAVVSVSPIASLNNVVLSSAGGVWRTEPGASLAFNATNLGGAFLFDNAGTTTNSGAMVCVADTVFTTAAGSANPFQWTGASIDAAGFTLTNAGRLESMSSANKFLAGRIVNAAGATWTCSQGNLYFNQSAAPGGTRLTNNGTFVLANGTGLPRNGGAQADAIFDNNGLLRVTGSGSNVSTLTVNNNPGGVVRLQTGGSLALPSDWSMSSGRLEGTGSFSSAGNGMVNAGGTVAPGLNGLPGVMSTSQRFNQAAGGTLEIALVNNGATQSASRLNLTGGGFFGQAQLGGTLRVTLPAGTSPPPQAGLSHVIVDAPGGLSGSFAAVVDANPVTDYRYTVSYTPTQAILRVIKRCNGADMGGTGADTNFDGVLDNNDFVVFIDLFFSANPAADVGSVGGVHGGDGAFDNNDFVVFVDLFFAGCGG